MWPLLLSKDLLLAVVLHLLAVVIVGAPGVLLLRVLPDLLLGPLHQTEPAYSLAPRGTSLPEEEHPVDLADVSEDTFLLRLHGAVLAQFAAPGDERAWQDD